MLIKCHHPTRELTLKGPRQVRALLTDLKLLPDTVLVIRNDTLITEDEMVADEETIEIRPVISGGSSRGSGGTGRVARVDEACHAV
jgi:sulfur carrier protein